MKKLFYTSLFITLLGFANIHAQTIVEVGDTLAGIIEAAADGDVIIIKPGQHKASFNTINIVDKSLTIKGEEGSPKPTVYIKSFSVSGADVSLTLQGIEFSGATFDSLTFIEDTITLAGEYLVNLTDTYTGGENIIIKDCIVRNLQRSVIRGDRAVNHVNNILVDDCVIFDLRGGGAYGPFRLKSRITFDDFTISNSTFHHIQSTFIDCKDMVSYPANIEIDHVTFYAWGGVIDAKYLFEIMSNDQANLVITNSILAKTNDTEAILLYGFRVMDEAYYEMGFSIMTPEFVVDDSAYADVEWDKTEFNEEDYDVPFTFPDTSNFGIPFPDDLYQFSDAGTLVGDPRWSTEPKPDAIEGIFNSTDLAIYPNPASQIMNILNAGTGKLEMYDILGVKVAEIDLVNSNLFEFDVAGFTPGMYVIRMNNSKGISLIIE